MATLEGTCQTADFMCVSILPDVCKSPVVPVPYPIVAYFNTAVSTSPNVNFHQVPAFNENSRLATVIGDEPGTGGGVISTVNKGFCRPVGGGLFSTTVRVNGAPVDCHLKTLMHMNCAGPEGPGNTIGQVVYSATMQPGPVGSAGRLPKSVIDKITSVVSEYQDDIIKLTKNAKMLYDVSQTDWSNPSAVLGSIGAVAGFAGWEGIKGLADKAGLAYKAATNDWSDLGSSLSALSGLASLGNLQQLSSALGAASIVAGVIKTDWDNPMAALNAAKNIAQLAGLDDVAKDLVLSALNGDGEEPKSLVPCEPAGTGSPGPASSSAPVAAKSDQRAISPEEVEQMKTANPIAYQRYDNLTEEQQKGVVVEGSGENLAFYIPGEGFSSTQADRAGDKPFSVGLMENLEEIFIAGKGVEGETGFLGLKGKPGNWYLFGGLIDLGSPEMPGAGDASFWFIPDRVLWADMSPYYDYHDLKYYGTGVNLRESLGEIFSLEAKAFGEGFKANPLNLPFQAIYSAATTTVGVGTATANSIKGVFTGLFGADGATSNLSPGLIPGCFPRSRQGATGSGAGAGGATSAAAGGASGPPGGKPGDPKIAVGEGAAAGAGTDGILVTIGGGAGASAAGTAIWNDTMCKKQDGHKDPTKEPEFVETIPITVDGKEYEVDIYKSDGSGSGYGFHNGRAQIVYGTNRDYASEANEMQHARDDARGGKDQFGNEQPGQDGVAHDEFGNQLSRLEAEIRSDDASLAEISERLKDCDGFLERQFCSDMGRKDRNLHSTYSARRNAMQAAETALDQGNIAEAKRIALSNPRACGYIEAAIKERESRRSRLRATSQLNPN